jgi:hypothetical protein
VVLSTLVISFVIPPHHSLTLYLSRFDFVMHHCPGKSMGKRNALLHRADHSPGADNNRDITLLKPKFFAAHALEGMTVEEVERDILRVIQKGVRDVRGEDAVVLAMKEFNKSNGKMLRSLEWAMMILNPDTHTKPQ